MPTGQLPTGSSIPFPSTWRINATIAGKPILYGTLIINSITNNYVTGAINFRGNFISIHGYWNEAAKQITLESPYANFVGNLIIVDEQQIPIRHYVLRGRFVMKPPSIHAGEHGSWIATTDIELGKNRNQIYESPHSVAGQAV